MAERFPSPFRPPRPFVRPVRRDPSGGAGPTPGAARGTRWRRTSHGWYVPSSVDGSLPEQRVAEVAALLPSGGALTGWAPLLLHGLASPHGRGPDGRSLLPFLV